MTSPLIVQASFYIDWSKRKHCLGTKLQLQSLKSNENVLCVTQCLPVLVLVLLLYLNWIYSGRNLHHPLMGDRDEYGKI